MNGGMMVARSGQLAAHLRSPAPLFTGSAVAVQPHFTLSLDRGTMVASHDLEKMDHATRRTNQSTPGQDMWNFFCGRVIINSCEAVKN